MINVQLEAINRTRRNFDRLLETLRFSGRIPEANLNLQTIQGLLIHLASLDSNNHLGIRVGAGEREGRVLSPLVEQLHLSFAHGIGRSGSLTEHQPKAFGSFILSEITNKLALDAIRYVGIPSTKAALVIPVGSGVALSLCLRAWKRVKRHANFVVFLRVDQISCFKSVLTAGLEPIIINCIQKTATNDGLTTNLAELETVLQQHNNEIVAVLSTTSCFAPREPDNLTAVGELCAKYGVKHLVNNDFGLQSPECRSQIQEAGLIGHVDVFVQSLDQNFLIPVGGSIVATFSEKSLQAIANMYAGRASVVPSRDLLITLLHLGRRGLKELYDLQQTNFEILRVALENFAGAIEQKVLDVKKNQISLAITLKGWTSHQQAALSECLTKQGVTGVRVVPFGFTKIIDGYEFVNFGSDASLQHNGYLSVACTIGTTREEVEELLKVLRDAVKISVFQI